jgi:hypothetical protein
MSSTIKYKFLNSKDSDVILFEGISLSLDALKRAVIERKNLTASGADLVVMDTDLNGAW